jgi:hypothetical protein
MSSNFEKMQERIARKGIQAADIRHSGLLTQEQIQFIDFDKVYMWVRTGDWKQKDFKRWLKALRVVE